MVAVTLLFSALLATHTQGGYFEQSVADSNGLRTEQARELDAYVNAMAADKSRLAKLFQPDYASPRAFEASARPLRAAYAASIGYPPPTLPFHEAMSMEQMGEDALGTYYRVKIPVVAGVHSEGIFILPKNRKGRVPLIISMHGGGGSPEVALFHGGANYHDMVRGAVKEGYAVYAPQHLFNAPGYPGDIRNKIDERLRLIGTTITAVEVAKITKALDVLLKRPEIDAKRVGMVGLSYGGYYALVTPALDTRIKVSVSSCYFGVQEFRFRANQNSVPSDFRTMDRFSLFRDSEIGALICPRALQIQAGKQDDAEHRDMGIELAPAVEAYYDKLGVNSKFEFRLLDGGHEFDDAAAWPFVKKFL